MEVIVAAVLAAAGFVVVVVALQRDAEVGLPAPSAPDWDPLPTRSDVARTDFPLRVPGYDPASVDLALDALADAYADLLAEADADTVARARRRAEARVGRGDGVDGVDAVDAASLPSDGSDETAVAAGASPAGERDGDPSGVEGGAAPGHRQAADGIERGTTEALRAQAALDAVERDGA